VAFLTGGVPIQPAASAYFLSNPRRHQWLWRCRHYRAMFAILHSLSPPPQTPLAFGTRVEPKQKLKLFLMPKPGLKVWWERGTSSPPSQYFFGGGVKLKGAEGLPGEKGKHGRAKWARVFSKQIGNNFIKWVSY